MIKKLSAVLIMGAMMAWGQAIPAGALPVVPEDAAVDGLFGDAALISDDQTFESSEWSDIDGASAEMSTSEEAEAKCKKIKNKKKRKKCLKKAQEEEPIVREVEFEYSCPCGVRVAGQGGAFQLGSATGQNIGGGPVTFDPSIEKYLTAETEDSSGQMVAVRIAMDTDPDDTSPNNTVADFCSSPEEPIEMPDVEAEFRVFVTAGTCADGSPSMPMSGTITFTLSNVPVEAAPEEE